MKRYRFVINPISGLKHSKEDLAQLIKAELPASHGFNVEISFTEYAGHARELAADAAEKEFDAVIAVGGDGTMNETASGLVHTKTALGLIPMGSGNGFARSMGIPLAPREALRRLHNPEIRLNDAGKINETYFFGVTGVGFDAQIGERFQDFGIRGPAPYFYIGLKEYFKYDYEEYELQFNGKKLSVRPLLITVANTPQYGNGAIIAPHAKTDDGKLELCIVDPIPFYYVVTQINKLFNGKIDQLPFYHRYQITDLLIRRSRERGVFHTDGEPHQGGRELHISILKKALYVYV